MAENSLKLYTIFHLNLAYSSIEEDQRAEVIKSCYRPLLNLARRYELPLGIEISGYSLEIAAELDPGLLEELRFLVTEGPCEFIGSGYAQLIGPLVPAKVNAKNLFLGNKVYQKLLGFKPGIALVNEQAYSAGLVQHYLEAGYNTLIMEWDNPARFHPKWNNNWRYFPQLAKGPGSEKIALLWNSSIAFQKFQRYAHGELGLDEYLVYLQSHTGDKPRAYPLYGNDVEIFDFRPGRYKTEALLHPDGEWSRIELLFQVIGKNKQFSLVAPSAVLGLLEQPDAGNLLSLESPEQQTPVKKQGKYNLTRWAVTGRNDLSINTACYDIYHNLEKDPSTSDQLWYELCYLWSSDFRTHITEKRWQKYVERLLAFKAKVASNNTFPITEKEEPVNLKETVQPSIVKDGQYLSIETETAGIKLNCRRGLAIEAITIKDACEQSLMGTLPHGYYDHIALGADWYSAHTVLEIPGRPKVSDLNPVEPEIKMDLSHNKVEISGAVNTDLGPVGKKVILDYIKPAVELNYIYEWPEIPTCSFRLGHITLNPEAFNRSTLFIETCNGGDTEIFYLAGKRINHGEPVSFMVSASGALGLTEGWIKVGDKDKALTITIDQSLTALVGLLTYFEIGNTYFCRIAFSAGEMDETSLHKEGISAGQLESSFQISFIR